MNYLTEGTFSSALGAFNDFKNFISGVKNSIGFGKKDNGPYLGGSISEYSKDLIMSFPMMCDNTLPAETASMISRANERHIITLLQLLFASQQISGSGGVEVIKKIHKNIKSNMSLDDYIDTVDNITSTVVGATNEVSLNREITRCERIMTESLKRDVTKSYPVSSFSERSLNDFSILYVNGKQVVKEMGPVFTPGQEIDPFAYGIYPGTDEFKDYINYDRYVQQGNKNRADNKRSDAEFKYQQQMQGKKFGFDKAKFKADQKYRQDMLKFQKDKAALDQDKFNLDRQRYANDLIRMQQQQDQQNAEFFTRQLLDTDVKKCNEMAPSLMIIKYHTVSSYTDADNKVIRAEKPFIAGVKSRLIPVDSMDIVERLATKNKTKISFLNFIRATTGEIRFIKDFLLSLDQAKIDSKNAIKKGPDAKMWKTLEFRASKNQRRKVKQSGNDASAITTLVINQETVNFLRKQYEFDLERIQNTRMIMDAYNLLGIIICDESIQVAKIYYAGNDTYEQQAYSFLEKESSDKSYKKVISLIGQINGR